MADRSGAAFFDVDKTLLPGVSAEMLLVRALLAGRLPGRFRWLPFIAEAFRLLPRGPTVARKANKAYLAGASPDAVRAWFEQVFVQEVEPRLGETGSLWVEHERAQGRAIVLLSGMPQLLLTSFERRFRADLAVGTPLEEDGRGRLTGRRDGPHPYGIVKREIVASLAVEHGWDPSRCSAYGDHRSDISLLEWVGFPYAVDPDPVLRREAIRRGWTLLSHGRQAARNVDTPLPCDLS